MLRKVLAGTLLSAIVFSACTRSNDVAGTETPEASSTTNSVARRSCASEELLQQQMQNDPDFRKKRAEIESQSLRFIENGNFRLVNGVYEIPVVVNVLYRTTAQNVSDAQINSQITVLNKDFSATNSDYNNVPSTFTNVRSGNTNIRFVLDRVVRKATTTRSWSTNDAMKSTTTGGLNPVSPTTKLNLWVCNMGGGILGYAQFPGGSSSTDGVVITTSGFGTSGTATAPFNLGRTATHEVGHWLNLRHIWGDANCGSDGVSDTPVHNAANTGCPASGHRSTCSGTPIEMWMNYMDYSDDACMYMFSIGQKNRMLATFASGGGRNSFAQP
jgi:hypothetical protein